MLLAHRSQHLRSMGGLPGGCRGGLMVNCGFADSARTGRLLPRGLGTFYRLPIGRYAGGEWGVPDQGAPLLALLTAPSHP